MSALRRFLAFWYDFVIGDDWRVAVAVVSALALTWLVHRSGTAAWWVVPVFFALVLPVSVWTRRGT